MAQTSLAIAGPYPSHCVSSNGTGSDEHARSLRNGGSHAANADLRQPILSNFRVLARINVILRAQGNSTRRN